jgi:hypothetical protein
MLLWVAGGRKGTAQRSTKAGDGFRLAEGVGQHGPRGKALRAKI